MTTTTAQKMEIQDLTSNHGLLTIKLGTAKTIRTFNNLIHVIQLNKYIENIDKIGTSLTTFENIDGFNDSLNVIKIKYREVQTKLQTLLPRFRSRRGLINGLGTVIKSITGNLDANDAIEINKSIEEIMKKQHDMEIEENSQIKINNQMLQRFENITNHINTQQTVIERYLNSSQIQLAKRMRSEETSIKYIQYLNQINFNIDLLNNHLTNIAEAIVLAKLNIISKQILNPEELTEIYKSFEKQSVDIKSNEHIYELLELQAYYNNSNIIFNIRIPSISQNTYSFFHIIPLPIENGKMITTKPYVMLNKNEIQYFDKACLKIEGMFYCKEPVSQEHDIISSCIANIINNNPAHCKLIEVEEDYQILQPEPNYILLINSPEVTIRSTCGPNQQKLNGTALVHFQDCKVEINGITYESKTNFYWEDIHIYPTTFTKINTTTLDVLNLQKLKNFHFENKKAIDLLQIRSHQNKIINYSVLSVIPSLLLIIILVHILKTYATRKTDTTNHHVNPQPSNVMIVPARETPESQFFWPSLHSKGGGVTYP